ncbi:xanthine dehydrogenase/oxidase-like isoform X2 [Tubulanus polymorphus]|uniref:xanthine dehydrogenase/oxidase-like isoform X2 n=1 Tax=Tubulanus polymorphus TaxID=672921 RepID=UPI003DA5F4F5
MSATDCSSLEFYVNGKKIIDIDVDPEWTLLNYIRRKLLLTGTKLACGQAGCGACTVMVSRYDRHQKKIVHAAVPACAVFIVNVHGMAVTTVEGVGSRKNLHPVQERLAKYHGSQCGFCTPGMVMSMYTLLRNNPNPSISEIENAMQGNLCRCTGYRPIYQGFVTFADKTDFDCGMGDQCCKKKIEISGMATNLHEGTFIPYKPDQEPIFPNELQLSDRLDKTLAHFKGKRIEWFRPTSLDELFELKKNLPDARFVNGGLNMRKYGIHPDKENLQLISLSHVSELHDIENNLDGISVGSACTLEQVSQTLTAETDRQHFSRTQSFVALNRMLNSFSLQWKNVATIGGHIVANRKKSDLIPVLMAACCKMTIISPVSERTVVINEHFLSDLTSLLLKPNELIKSIFIPFQSKSEFLEVYSSNSVQATSVFRMVVEKDTSIIQELCIISSGLDGSIKLASETMKEAVGKKLCDPVVSSLSKILTDEIKPCTDNTGGAVQYRCSLILGFFFKFYLSIQINLSQLLGMESGQCIPQSYTSVLRELPSEPLKVQQIFEKTDESQPEHDTIGKPLPQIINPSHVSGESVFIDDIPAYTNELFIAYVYSKHAHAKILSVDPSEALNVDGVLSYIDHNDVPASNMFGRIVKDEYIFPTKLVDFNGQIISAVVAENREIARKAAKLVKVEYEVLQPVITITDAIEAKSFFETVVKIDKGDVDDVLSTVDHVVEGELYVGAQEHFYMETKSALVVPLSENDEILIYAGTQNLAAIQEDVANALGLKENRIIVKNKRIGGAFGGKEENSAIVLPVAVAAYKLKRPVRCVLNRDEDMRNTSKRHPFLGKYKVGFSSQGIVQAADITLYANCGFSHDTSTAVVQLAVLDTDASYWIPKIRVKGYLCKTNLPSNSSFRGMGRPEVAIITESWIEHIARNLVMSPEKIREVNSYRTIGPSTFGLLEIDGRCLSRCWNDVIEQSNYEELRRETDTFNAENRWKKRGVSVVPTKCGIGFPWRFMNQAGALVHVYRDGTVLITYGGIEMGQGLHTKIIQIASRVLAISTDKIHIQETSTDKVPNSITSSASTSSDMYGMAVKYACEKLIAQLQPMKEKYPGDDWEAWVMNAWLNNIHLSATGYYGAPDEYHYDWDKVTGRRYNYYTYGAACSVVEIDCLTGDHKILKTDIVMDVGASLNPAIDIGQIDGAFMQGYGYYMTEQLHVSPEGKILSTGPASYNLPRFRNLPNEYNVTILKGSRNPRAIYSSKGIGEPPLILATSVYFAVKEAILSARSDFGVSGYFRLDCPATAEKIRLACTDQFTQPFDVIG